VHVRDIGDHAAGRFGPRLSHERAGRAFGARSRISHAPHVITGGCPGGRCAIDACCYEEWVRRNPINDYTIPRAGLIRGNKARAMVERVFGDTRAEDLSRSFYCASVNLRRSGLVISREGLLCEIVGASMSLPLIAPPVRNEDALLIDGSLLDNLPLEPMSAAGEGPVVAIDIKGGEERPSAPGEPGRSGARDHRRRLPSLPETLGRAALCGPDDPDTRLGCRPARVPPDRSCARGGAPCGARGARERTRLADGSRRGAA
jgi:hypothetical protein